MTDEAGREGRSQVAGSRRVTTATGAVFVVAFTLALGLLADLAGAFAE